MTIRGRRAAALLLALSCFVARPAPAQDAPGGGDIMITVLLRHDQSLTLDQIYDRLKAQHFAEKFPPPGVEVVSWTAVMGLGQIVTLRLPPEKLRELNRAVAESAWGAFRTEFYPTYDYRPIAARDRVGLPSALR